MNILKTPTKRKIGYTITKVETYIQTHSDVTTAKDLGTTEKNALNFQYVKDVEKVEQTTWTVNNNRSALTVKKTMQLI